MAPRLLVDAVSLPERRYELAARLLADAFAEAESGTESPHAALRRRAHERGRRLGGSARATHDGDDRDAAIGTLRTFGFEPRPTDQGADTVVLVNCPFHSLAQQHTELICGMNLSLVAGLTAHLAPEPGQCCVRLQR